MIRPEATTNGGFFFRSLREAIGFAGCVAIVACSAIVAKEARSGAPALAQMDGARRPAERVELILENDRVEAPVAMVAAAIEKIAPAPVKAEAPAPVVEPEPAGPTLTIEFSFLEDCWLEATDARGARLFYGLGEAGARRRVSGEPPIDVFLGNANGVAVTVDGEPYVVPMRNRQGNLARFVVDVPTD